MLPRICHGHGQNGWWNRCLDPQLSAAQSDNGSKRITANRAMTPTLQPACPFMLIRMSQPIVDVMETPPKTTMNACPIMEIWSVGYGLAPAALPFHDPSAPVPANFNPFRDPRGLAVTVYGPAPRRPAISRGRFGDQASTGVRMRPWTHMICAACWNATRETEAVEGASSEAEQCCFCGEMTTSGIWVRHDPAELSCNHED